MNRAKKTVLNVKKPEFFLCEVTLMQFEARYNFEIWLRVWFSYGAQALGRGSKLGFEPIQLAISARKKPFLWSFCCRQYSMKATHPLWSYQQCSECSLVILFMKCWKNSRSEGSRGQDTFTSVASKCSPRLVVTCRLLKGFQIFFFMK